MSNPLDIEAIKKRLVALSDQVPWFAASPPAEDLWALLAEVEQTAAALDAAEVPKAGPEGHPLTLPERVRELEQVARVGAKAAEERSDLVLQLSGAHDAATRAEQSLARAMAQIARLREECDAAQAAVAAQAQQIEWLKRPVPYRPGLPSVEQVRAHEARGGRWQVLDPKNIEPAEAVMMKLRVVGDAVRHGWQSVAECQWSARSSYRPCLPDGTPCPWEDP